MLCFALLLRPNVTCVTLPSYWFIRIFWYCYNVTRFLEWVSTCRKKFGDDAMTASAIHTTTEFSPAIYIPLKSHNIITLYICNFFSFINQQLTSKFPLRFIFFFHNFAVTLPFFHNIPFCPCFCLFPPLFFRFSFVLPLTKGLDIATKLWYNIS